MKSWLGISLLGVSLVLAAWSVTRLYAADRETSITVGPETTRLTGPLRGDGTVDYVAAIDNELFQGITVENNAVVPLRTALGTRELNPALMDAYFERLGIDPVTDPGVFVPFFEYIRKLPGDAVEVVDPDEDTVQSVMHGRFNTATSRPWTKDELPLIAGWLESCERGIKLAEQAVARPRWYSPFLSNDDMLISVLLPDTQMARSFAREFLARAMMRLGHDDLEGAWKDLSAMHRLARLVGQGPTIIEGLVAHALDSMAHVGNAKLSQHPKLTGEQARRFARELQQLGPARPIADRIDHFERLMFLDTVTTISREPDRIGVVMESASQDDDLLKFVRNVLLKTTVDFDVVLKMGNERYDRIVAATKVTPRSKRLEAVKAVLDDVGEQRKEIVKINLVTILGGGPTISERAGHALTGLLMPAVAQAREVEDRGRVRHQLSLLAFALADYKLKHGAYPESLGSLDPDFIDEVPDDLYAEQPLKYRTTASGYLVYSVGRNGTDDKGRTFGEEPRGSDDLVVRTGEAAE